MIALRKRRHLALALVLALLVLSTPQVSGAPLPEVPTVTEVVGSIPFPAFACAGCIGRGIFIVSGGWASVMVASLMPGSAAVVGGCIAACQRAIFR